MSDTNQKVKENKGLVGMVITEFFPEYLGDEEMFQTGLIGLWKAVESYKKGKQAFSTYAVLLIKRKIIDEIRKRERKKEKEKGVEFIELDKLFDDLELSMLLGKEEEGYEEVEISSLLMTKDKLTNSVMNLFTMGYSTKEIATILKTRESFVKEVADEIKRNLVN